MLTVRRAVPMSASPMKIYPILTIPDAVLRKEAASVERVDDDLRRLMDDMLGTMYDAPGVGLAAPQIGILRRVIVMDAARDDDPPDPLVMANPEILALSDEMRTHEEGCLSIPDHTAEVERPAKIRVAFLGHDGKPQETELEGIWATIVQHEIDHLNGVLFIDYMSRLKRDMIVKKFTKAKRVDAM
jgi:peptide deformylase